MSHTPGPWEIRRALILGPKFQLVAAQVSDDNAKLIAAAPDLVKALDDLLDAFRVCVGTAAFDEFDASNPAVMAARALLAKVRT